MPHQSPPLVWTVLFIIAFGAFMGLLFLATSRTLLVTIAAHLSLNITTAMGGVHLTSSIFWGAMAIAFWAITGLWSLSERSRCQMAKVCRSRSFLKMFGEGLIADRSRLRNPHVPFEYGKHKTSSWPLML
jgi:hypothetical protein